MNPFLDQLSKEFNKRSTPLWGKIKISDNPHLASMNLFCFTCYFVKDDTKIRFWGDLD